MVTNKHVMPSENWDNHQKKIIFSFGIQSLLARLEFQRNRVLEKAPRQPGFIQAVHDADYYIIFLRRLYRQVQDEAKYDSRVANLKGKYRQLVDKIRMRDHFEHDVDPKDMPATDTKDLEGISSKAEVIIATSVFDSIIVSGEYKWDLHKDHNEFVELMNEFIQLYPFNEKTNNNLNLWRKLKKWLSGIIK